MYAIIDIETIGGNHQSGGITEVAILLHDGNKITHKFETLVNPGQMIPPYVANLTGISNDMVRKAPKFEDISKEIVELTENKILVAHNAKQDYNFLRSAYSKNGLIFQREYLCTISLSKQLIPGRKAYGLTKLCEELNIAIDSRHRAMGDALATVKLFEILIEINGRLL